jgi:hypothetical protein
MIFFPDNLQDTINLRQLPSKDSIRNPVDSSYSRLTGKPAEKTVQENFQSEPVHSGRSSDGDISLAFSEDSIANVTFFTEHNYFRNLSVHGGDTTVISLAEKAKYVRTEKHDQLIPLLRNGESAPSDPVDNDFIILILLAAAFLLTVVRSSVKNFQPVTRFFLFRGLKDPASSDTGVLFHWQTTLLNLMSFLIISMFAYQSVTLSGLIPEGLSGVLFWLISLAVIIAGLTTRHFICAITGDLSGKKDIFREYLLGIYQSYHFAAFILFILIVLTSFTAMLSEQVYIIAGVCGIALMYLIRITRLFIIFINRNISIFYLILYLCALEILPVAILIRYFSGPVLIG